MVQKVHIAHNGIEATIKLAKENIFWQQKCANEDDEL